MRRILLAGTMTTLAIGLLGPVLGQESKATTVSLFIFEARVRSFAPGLEATISLSEDQRTKLGGIYDGVFGTPAVRLANSVLQDTNASLAQRQTATAIVLQAQADFRTQSRAVFTDPQRELIDRVYAAFNRVYERAQEQLVKEVTGNFGKELEQILTSEQKQAMEKHRAELEAAKSQPAATEPAGGKPNEAQPGKTE
jgi:hypothetical protein